MRLKDKVAIVTGAGRGIGRAIAQRFAAEGATVAVDDLNLETATQVAREITQAGGAALPFGANVTRSTEMRAMVGELLDRHGRIDILVNNAGGSAALRNRISAFKDADEETWKWVIELNLHGTMIGCQAVLPNMVERRDGSIINFGSIAGVRGLPNWTDYAAAKGAIIAFTQSLATEVGEFGINVNCVSPGAIQGETRRDWTTGTWLQRGGEPEEVAALVLFLASDEARYITGANYLIDGGRTLGPLR
ncbi:MAG: SDR family oxidoreductase [Armatimonadetes bacterium]|nr:SDR family oxidoreductase [Armatimonadota bacterium]